MTPAEFDFIAQYLKQKSGLVLTPDKQYLLDSRLTPVARRFNLPDLTALILKLRSGGDETVSKAVVEAMTTNESFFFRDKTPFEQFERMMLPALMKARGAQKRLRIWCAAASTGQEPYSLAMILKDKALSAQGWAVEIVGTDLSTEVLARATDGLYSQFEVQRGLPIQMLVKHFDKEGEQWRIKPDIRNAVKYRQANLLEPFRGHLTYDVIYCRNVLIYFDQPAKKDILERMAKLLAHDGYLVLGAAETVIGLTTAFAPVEGARGIYAKTAAASSLQAAI